MEEAGQGKMGSGMGNTHKIEFLAIILFNNIATKLLDTISTVSKYQDKTLKTLLKILNCYPSEQCFVTFNLYSILIMLYGF